VRFFGIILVTLMLPLRLQYVAARADPRMGRATAAIGANDG
jgi:hypothetical protein